MKIRYDELDGEALDYAVAVLQGVEIDEDSVTLDEFKLGWVKGTNMDGLEDLAKKIVWSACGGDAYPNPYKNWG
jgi:hypothetical protein